MRPTTALQVKRQQFFAFLILARSLTRAHKSVRKNIFWTLYFGAAKMVPRGKIACRGPSFRSPLTRATSTRFAMTVRFFEW
jgi:hypothetical protein